MHVELTIVHDETGSESHAAASALARHAPADFTVRLAPLQGPLLDPDTTPDDSSVQMVLLLEHGAAASLRARLPPRLQTTAILATAFHAGWPDDLPAFFEAYAASDLLLISTRAYWDRTGRLPSTVLAPWGFDEDVFTLERPLDWRRHVVLWTGPAHDARRTGQDRFLQPLVDRLGCSRGLASELRPIDGPGSGAPSGREMAAWFNAGTVFVCASRSEGTPAAALEAAACGCTIVSTRVGCLPELIVDGENGYLVDRDLDALERGIVEAAVNYQRLAARMQDDIRAWGWSARTPVFYDALRAAAMSRLSNAAHATSALLEPSGSRDRTCGGPDLSDAVTVFVTSVGAPSIQACRELLRRQDCTFQVEIIEGVRPLSAALQRMLDRCSTPFYLQVDEDMLLYSHAVRTLFEQMTAAPPDVAMVVGQLYDVHLGRCIQGLKMSRLDVARCYPWKEEPIVVRRLARMQADGHRVLELPVSDTNHPAGAVGLHATHATPAMLYDRYFTLERLRRSFPSQLAWFEPFPAVFLARFLAERTDADLHALLGVLAGAVAGPLPRGSEVRDGRLRLPQHELRAERLASLGLGRDERG
jgi:hypothetical protein